MHLDRGLNVYWSLYEEGGGLYEFARVLLDPDAGYFTDEVNESLADAGGLALLIMDRVTLARPCRGRGLAAILAAEAIHQLLPGCRACSPGIADLGLDQQRTLDRAEWDRVTARIRTGWERVGFRPYFTDC
ncbi:hypothetical protein A8W25_30310 [Streptomyces sp. ERV7]|uniref:hypothetical protein n=1 Tax=Streptomyces sp. ERV7 TaxID=1322334 RepID=UPI0007F34B21|nr:hypothetical protein [Streptomyces sp. ERV7]OAR21986.1 hypothetical protein A8W25_30310 [Streptomyces sp. ERV7]